MDEDYAENTKKKISELLKNLENYTPDTEKYQGKKSHILYVLNKIIGFTPDSYFETCEYCTKNELPHIITRFNYEMNNEGLDFLFRGALRYTKEHLLRGNGYTPQDVAILRFYEDHAPLTAFEATDAAIFDATFDAHTILNITQETTALNDKITANIATYNKTLREWDDKVNTYRDELRKQYLKYNFVALSRAFVHMLGNSNNTLNSQKNYLLVISGATLSIPILMFTLSSCSIIPKISENPLAYIPIAALTLLLIYYFRVILHHYNNTRSQCLQLELRRTICCFAEGYNEYKKANPSAINDKLENLIFSSIVLNPDKIPSTFDGLDQITNLLKTCTKSKQ